MTGGQWVSHPGGHIEYEVNIIHGSSPITEGIEDFKVYTEQYYMHVDPAIEVLATSRVPVCKYYNAANKACDMPLAWTKYWGNGRAFYSSLGHCDSFFDEYPQAELLMRRGMVWAAEGKQYEIDNNLTTDRFDVEGY
jgi:type 1 glutamine amidotransferase